LCLSYLQIKYEELSSFTEVMAAGTAAALVPIRSITRESDARTSTFIDASSEEPGPICLKLLSTLKGVQLGKIEDTFGWNSKVEAVDVKQYAAAAGGAQTNGEKLP
jgi:branched-chain amino acid aminotransferase